MYHCNDTGGIMAELQLLHGSQKIIEKPSFSFGNDHNDYGRGFYCTGSADLAGEWACRKGTDGFVNRYTLDDEGLITLDLTDGKHNVLNWIAILLKNRVFSLNSQIALEAKDYLLSNFSIDTSKFDLVTGYRADGSYFRFAESFLENSLSLDGLTKALYLGKLGIQTVLVSEKAFGRIRFVSSSPVEREQYYPRFLQRDLSARQAYSQEIEKAKTAKDDIFVIDILRKEIGNDDPRIQRIVSE